MTDTDSLKCCKCKKLLLKSCFIKNNEVMKTCQKCREAHYNWRQKNKLVKDNKSKLDEIAKKTAKEITQNRIETLEEENSKLRAENEELKKGFISKQKLEHNLDDYSNFNHDRNFDLKLLNDYYKLQIKGLLGWIEDLKNENLKLNKII